MKLGPEAMQAFEEAERHDKLVEHLFADNLFTWESCGPDAIEGEGEVFLRIEARFLGELKLAMLNQDLARVGDLFSSMMLDHAERDLQFKEGK